MAARVVVLLLSVEIEHLPPISGKRMLCSHSPSHCSGQHSCSCLAIFYAFGVYFLRVLASMKVIYCYYSSCCCSKWLISTMACAQSKLKVRYQNSQAYEKRILAAVELYWKSCDDVLLNNNHKVPSYAEVACMCNVPKETLHHHIARLPSHPDVAAKCGWLNHAKSQELIDHICHDLFPRRRDGLTGQQTWAQPLGWPLSHQVH